jgi:predicted PolB exonuclease-like 3'-5' exonuclease
VASILTADQVAYGEWQFTLESVTFEDERAAIERIDELLAGRKCLLFNGKGFDLGVLALVAMRASAFDCRNITEAWTSPRFGGSHIDLADLISNFGAAPKVSLEMLCDAAAVPVKTNGHGGDVEHMLATQGIEAVKRYCEEDVTSTLTMFALVHGSQERPKTRQIPFTCAQGKYLAPIYSAAIHFKHAAERMARGDHIKVLVQ